MYNFWDYFGGAVVLLAFGIPFIGALLVQASVFIVAMFGSFMNTGQGRPRHRTLTIRTRDYDYDEDQY